MRFGLIANLHRVGAQSAISSFIEWIKKRDQQAVLCDDLKRMNQDTFPRLPRNRLAGEVDVLVAMGCPADIAGGAIRVSFSPLNTEEEAVEAGEAIAGAARDLSRKVGSR